jgi:activator of HSP90 ATPase
VKHTVHGFPLPTVVVEDTLQNGVKHTNKKLVQQWDFGDIEPHSIVTMKLHEHKQGCSLEVRHTNIPEEAWEDISTGWEDTYMASLLDFFN